MLLLTFGLESGAIAKQCVRIEGMGVRSSGSEVGPATCVARFGDLEPGVMEVIVPVHLTLYRPRCKEQEGSVSPREDLS